MAVAPNAEFVSIHGGELVDATNYTKNDHTVINNNNNNNNNNNTVINNNNDNNKYSYKDLAIAVGICLFAVIISCALVLHHRSPTRVIPLEHNGSNGETSHYGMYSIALNLLQEGFNLLIKRAESGALHDSQERSNPPKCHNGTRLAVLQEIKEWANHPVDTRLRIQTLLRPVSIPKPRFPPILWLRGSAGTGKSAIAQTLSEDWQKEGRLAATYFFSRAIVSRNQIAPVVATIAYQLSALIPGLDDCIRDEIKMHPLIFSRSMKAQVAALIERPLKKLPGHPPDSTVKIIVIDGLDEIAKPQEQEELLGALGSMIMQQTVTVPLRLLVSSRSEPVISSVFRQPHFLNFTEQFDLSIRQQETIQDIEIFLRSKFSGIKQNRSWLEKQSWPSDDVISTLVGRAGGLFIYASAAMDYISQGPPEELLKVVMDLKGRTGDQNDPFIALDELYMQILLSLEVPTLDFVKDTFSHILAIQNCPDSLYHQDCTAGYSCSNATGIQENPKPLDDLFLKARSELNWHLDRLHTFIDIDESYRPEIRHKEIHDFIMNSSRSHQFYLDKDHLYARASLLLLKRLLFWSPPKFSSPLTLVAYVTGLSCSLRLAGPWKELTQAVLAVVQPEDEPYHEYAKSIRPKGFRDRKDVLAEAKHEMFQYLHRQYDQLEQPLDPNLPTKVRLRDWEQAAVGL